MDNRELDREVGEKIFGHTTIGKGPVGIDYDDCDESYMPATAYDEAWLYCPHCEREPGWCEKYDTSGEFGHGKYSPEPYHRYSTDISHTWRIVDKLIQDGWHLDLYHAFEAWELGAYPPDRDKATWQACFKQAIPKWAIAADNSPMRAICRAALQIYDADPVHRAVEIPPEERR